MTTSGHKHRKIELNEDMTVYNAVEQKTRLLNELGGCEELDLDLSQVSEMDSAGFQILYLAKREALKMGKVLRMTAHSKAVTDLLDLYNMASYFGDPMVITAKEHAGNK